MYIHIIYNLSIYIYIYTLFLVLPLIHYFPLEVWNVRFWKFLYELRGQMLAVKKCVRFHFMDTQTHPSNHFSNQLFKSNPSSECARGNPWSDDQNDFFWFAPGCTYVRPFVLIYARSCALIFVRIWMHFQQVAPNLKYARLFSKTRSKHSNHF